MKVAVVYDRVNKWGGAERVLLALHELFPKANLYTSVYSPKNANWAKVFPKVIPSFLQNAPFLQTRHEQIPYLMPLAFECFDFRGFDLVISVTSECAKGIITRGKTKHICYCLTPTRYLWSSYNQYFHEPLQRFISKPVVSYMRRWDKIASTRPDAIISISKAVQKRVKKYYKRSSEIIYPPVDTERFQGKFCKNKTEKFFLLVSRLVKYKKVDLAIEAFNQLNLPLLVVGIGKELPRLKSIAGKNITFLERLSDDELANYYKNAQALIFPQEEDFGLVAVEAQAAGTPVIAYKKGGALDIIIEGKTGIFFDKQTVKELKYAVTRLENHAFDSNFIQTNAKRFSKQVFIKNITKYINDII
jgi:glycosyltransferase involved in cell wall biosynthesis